MVPAVAAASPVSHDDDDDPSKNTPTRLSYELVLFTAASWTIDDNLLSRYCARYTNSSSICAEELQCIVHCPSEILLVTVYYGLPNN